MDIFRTKHFNLYFLCMCKQLLTFSFASLELLTNFDWSMFSRADLSLAAAKISKNDFTESQVAS
jgi:hypothetical protein